MFLVCVNLENTLERFQIALKATKAFYTVLVETSHIALNKIQVEIYTISNVCMMTDSLQSKKMI